MTLNKKELLRFLLAGFGAVATDMGSYFALQWFLPLDVAKTASFILGSLVAFLVNKFWTFESKAKPAGEFLKFAILYSITLGVNVWVNHTVFEAIPNKLLAFLFATGSSTALNFIGQKWWVFRK
jgi:putative flippase GtrA